MSRYSIFTNGDLKALLEPLVRQAVRDFHEKRNSTPPVVPPKKYYGKDHLRLAYSATAQTEEGKQHEHQEKCF